MRLSLPPSAPSVPLWRTLGLPNSFATAGRSSSSDWAVLGVMGSQGLPCHAVPSGRSSCRYSWGKAGFRAPTGSRLIRSRISPGVVIAKRTKIFGRTRKCPLRVWGQAGYPRIIADSHCPQALQFGQSSRPPPGRVAGCRVGARKHPRQLHLAGIHVDRPVSCLSFPVPHWQRYLQAFS